MSKIDNILMSSLSYSLEYDDVGNLILDTKIKLRADLDVELFLDFLNSERFVEAYIRHKVIKELKNG